MADPAEPSKEPSRSKLLAATQAAPPVVEVGTLPLRSVVLPVKVSLKITAAWAALEARIIPARGRVIRFLFMLIVGSLAAFDVSIKERPLGNTDEVQLVIVEIQKGEGGELAGSLMKDFPEDLS